MTRVRITGRLVSATAALLLLLAAWPAAAGAAAAAPAPGLRTTAELRGYGARPAGCAARTGPRVAHCYLSAQPAPAQAAAALSARTAATCTLDEQDGYSPCNLRSAYQLTSLVSSHGQGQTVAVVDAYDDPDAASDLATYRSNFGLPACTKGNGCFKKVNQEGVAGHYPAGDMGWGQEISIDLDMVSAICPKCHILLVEANSSGFGDLFTAEQEAITLGAHVISNSWGTGEFDGENSYDAALDTPGEAITFSSGDGAYQAGVQYPSASPYVTSVGGTILTPASTGRLWSEQTWVTPGSSPPVQGSGSGCSAYEAKPSWQTDTGCGNRTTADVSAVATNVLGYDSYESGGGGWYFFSGTSVSSPITAGVYALAGNASSQTVAPASLAYANPTHLYDITKGLATGTCSPIYLCQAGKGYDGPTGMGTPKGIGAY
jgi:subtilase family serine protease